MSTLRVSTIQDTAGSNSSTPAAIANGICKAWVNFNGTGTVAIRASYNVSSITDAGVGLYEVNLTNAMPDANYTIVMSAGWAALGNVLGNFTASLVPVVTGYFTNFGGGASSGDNSQIYVAIFR